MAKSKASAAPAPANASAQPASDGKPLKNLYLLDAPGSLLRAFHALPAMNRPDGTPVNAVYGFCRMLADDILDKPEVDHVAMILDASGKTFRDQIYDKYKANRSEPPDDLVPQFPLIREAAKAFNVTVCELSGFEADDLIATYARLALEAGATCTIVSSDKDLMQLIRPGVEMMDPIKKIKLGPEAVMEKFGVTPDKVIDVQALAGDSTDNVPGVPGIGVKTAAQLLAEYGTLEALLERAGEIKQPKRREALIANAELARISKKLVTLSCDVKLDTPLEGLERRKLDVPQLLEFVKANEFRALATRLLARHGGAGAAQASAAGPKVDTAPPAPPAVASASLAAAPKAEIPLQLPAAPFDPGKYELVQDKATL